MYYDPNFRASHKNEAMKLAPTIIENLEYADIVRGSQDDFQYMYGLQDADKIYKDKIKFYCPRFICTAGGNSIALRTNKVNKSMSARKRSMATPVCHWLGLAAAVACNRCLSLCITSKEFILSQPLLSSLLPGMFARSGRPESKGATSTD